MTSTSTRRLSPVAARERWLYRRDGSDYGPVSTDELLAAIGDKKVDLQTQVCSLATGRWLPAAEHAMLRDYYAKCVARWEREAFHSEADAHATRLARRRVAHGRLWGVAVVGVIVALGFGAWVVWRLTQAAPLGIDEVVTLPRFGALPPVEQELADPPRLPTPRETTVPRLPEPETYDTAGVGFEGEASSAGVTRLDFGVDGRVQGISRRELDRVVKAAKGGLHECAKQAARRDRRFKGTNVGFTVEPGKITGITVGREVSGKPAFRACVKAALRRVPVPVYTGGPRRVTVPLKVVW